MSFIYDSCVHSQEEKFYFLCTIVGGESFKECAYSKGEKTFFIRKSCFVLFYFMALWVTFSIYALLFSSYHVYVLYMHTFLCYCTLLIACSDDHLFFYVIIVVFSIWLFYVWSSCSYVSHLVYMIVIYLLLYICPLLLALPWGSNVFCASVSGYKYFVLSSSHVLDLGVSKFCHCSQTHV